MTTLRVIAPPGCCRKPRSYPNDKQSGGRKKTSLQLNLVVVVPLLVLGVPCLIVSYSWWPEPYQPGSRRLALLMLFGVYLYFVVNSMMLLWIVFALVLAWRNHQEKGKLQNNDDASNKGRRSYQEPPGMHKLARRLVLFRCALDAGLGTLEIAARGAVGPISYHDVTWFVAALTSNVICMQFAPHLMNHAEQLFEDLEENDSSNNRDSDDGLVDPLLRHARLQLPDV